MSLPSRQPSNRSASATSAGKPALGEERSGEVDARDVARSILRQRWVVLGVAAVLVALVAVLTLLQEPTYEGTATIRVDTQGGRDNMLMERFAGMAGVRAPSRSLDTDLLVLESRQIAEGVVDSLNLQVELLEPHRPRGAVFAEVAVTRDARPGRFILERLEDDGYRLTTSMEIDGVLREERSRVEPGTPFQAGDATLSLHPGSVAFLPERIEFRVRPFRSAVSALRGQLAVDALRGEVVELRFQSRDSLLAAAVPNAVTESFVRYKHVTSRSDARQSIDFLQGQVTGQQRRLVESEESLRDFRERARVVSPREEATEQVRRLATLQARRDELEADREALRRVLARVNASDDGVSTTGYRQLAAYPVFFQNLSIQNVLNALTRLEDERAELMVTRTEENIDVQGIDQRIGELETQLFTTAQNYLENLDNEMASVDATLAGFSDQLERIPAREVEFARLSREQELNEEIYTLLQTRLKEAEIREAEEPSDVRVLDTALVPQRPSSPRPVRNIGLAALVGLMLGFGVAFGRAIIDPKVRTRDDIFASAGSVPVLGMIPRLPGRQGARLNGWRNGKRGRHPVPSAGVVDPRLVTYHDPRSPASEAFRGLRTNLTLTDAQAHPGVILITSTGHGDGKSTSAANVAVSMAQQGRRALLVDADLRKGGLHALFGLAQGPGLAEVLRGECRGEQAIQQVGMEGAETPLHVLSSGAYPANPAELLDSARMRELLREARSRYEVVVLDAPPVNLVTDAAVLGTLADATILVTRAGVTRKQALEDATAQLLQLRAPLSGVVMNDVRNGEAGYYG